MTLAPRRDILARAPKSQAVGLTIYNAADGVAEILIYDEIGRYGVSAGQFARELAQITASTIRLRINSPGGSVFDGLAIHNSLRGHPARVEVVVEGLAASAASFIMLAGDTISIADNSFVMIHRAWGVGVGNCNDLSELAAMLEKIDGQLAAMYAKKTGKPEADMLAVMDAETWFTAQEALDAGLVDSVGTAASASAHATLQAGVFKNAPAALIGDSDELEPPAPPPDPDSPQADEHALATLRVRLALAAIDMN